jgi:hypothetical protein
MSLLEIDTDATRLAARQLVATDLALAHAHSLITRAAMTAAFTHEHIDAAGCIATIRDEAGLVARILDLTADRAEIADSALWAMLGRALGSTFDRLVAVINDAVGTSVTSLLTSIDPALMHRVLADMSPAAAAAWFESLTQSERLRMVALHPGLFEASPAAQVVRRWIDGLGSDELRELYTMRALDRAGIDGASWRPALGLDANRDSVEGVYEYYAELYRGDTDRFWWAGMAALIGPSFYGGFQDLDTFASMFDALARIERGPLGTVVPGGLATDQIVAIGTERLGDEMEWYQLRLMSMQQEIFFDMAPAHEAYLDGGVDMVARLYADDPYDAGQAAVRAWRDIDVGWRTGDVHLVTSGNEALLRREQQRVIRDDYDAMRERPLTGRAVTYVMTAVGAPSVPGARTFAEVFPAHTDVSQYVGTPRTLPEPPVIGWLVPDVPIPHLGVEGRVTVDTPLPDGNISVFDDRWRLITEDTLPVYVDLAAHHPDQIVDVLSTPVSERAEAYTIVHRLDDLVADAVTNWDVHVDLDLEAGW